MECGRGRGRIRLTATYEVDADGELIANNSSNDYWEDEQGRVHLRLGNWQLTAERLTRAELTPVGAEWKPYIARLDYPYAPISAN